MQRRFAIIGHRAPSKGKLNLNDLAGSCGRMDVLVRAVNTALFISHGMREDTHITLHLKGKDGPARRVWFDSENLRGLHVDERAIAGRISKILQEPIPPIGHWIEAEGGIRHSGGDIGDTLAEWIQEGVSIHCLDAEGEPIDEVDLSANSIGFFLSDDLPFDIQEEGILDATKKVSLGQNWLQGHACIAICHHVLDSH